jgi:hypothetical protein
MITIKILPQFTHFAIFLILCLKISRKNHQIFVI